MFLSLHKDDECSANRISLVDTACLRQHFTKMVLTVLHGHCYPRRVDVNGSVVVADTHYYIRQTLRGQYITLQIDAPTQEFCGLSS